MIYGLFIKHNGKDVVKVLVLVMDRGTLGGHYHALGNCARSIKDFLAMKHQHPHFSCKT